MLLTLRPPQGRANPGTQDFERQLFRDGVHALGTVTASRVNRIVDAGHAPLTALRERISLHIQERVVDSDAAALIAALAVGDTGNVSREQWRVFNATGTTHLVAISGLHVTLFAVVAFAVARYLWRYCYRLVRLQRDSFASICAFSAAAAYATLAGLSVPTTRTLIMLGAWLLARSLARVTRPFQPLGIALLAVLLFDSFAPLSAGFWLSFVAMAVIILVSSGRAMPRPLWREALAVQGAHYRCAHSLHAGAVWIVLAHRSGGERAGDSGDELGARPHSAALGRSVAAVDRRVELRAGVGRVAPRRGVAMACGDQRSASGAPARESAVGGGTGSRFCRWRSH